MKDYTIKYQVLNNFNDCLYEGETTLKGKNKKDIRNFIKSRAFLQLEENDFINIISIEPIKI